MKTVLTIAGSDCSGGAGIQADLKTIAAHGLYGMSVITALTAQNTLGVSDVMPVPAAFLKEQLDSVISDIRPDAVKIGMIPDKEQLLVIAAALKEQKITQVVVDPVMAATSGRKLSGDASGDFFLELFAEAALITPNIPEAARLLGEEIRDKKEVEQAAASLAKKYHTAVLIKGDTRIPARMITFLREKRASGFRGRGSIIQTHMEPDVRYLQRSPADWRRAFC